MEKINITEELPKNIAEYVSVQFEIQKLKITDKAATALAAFITVAIIAVMGFITVIFISIFAALRIGQHYNNIAKGFMMVAMIYALLFILLMIFRKSLLLNRMRNSFIRIFLS